MQIKSALFVICAALTCTALADQSAWKPFRTPIKCKTIEAELTSICHPTRIFDEPAICKLQTLEFVRPPKHKIALFHAVQSPGVNEEPSLGRHAFNWFCSNSGKGGAEILTLDIGNWFNNQDEDIVMFNDKGLRLTKKQVNQVVKTTAWREAQWDREIHATAYGTVIQPGFE